jgi:hypothetical protein
MLATINGERVAAGRPKLGFITPYLYQNYSLFANDITSGNNKCAEEAHDVCCTQGFYAASGWDPVTGLGSIDFVGLYDLIYNHGFTFTPRPTSRPTAKPTAKPTAPTAKPTARPTAIPTTGTPSVSPTFRPTSGAPTVAPTKAVNGAKSNIIIVAGVVGGGGLLLCAGFGAFVYYGGLGDQYGFGKGSDYSGSSYEDSERDEEEDYEEGSEYDEEGNPIPKKRKHKKRKKRHHRRRPKHTDADSDGYDGINYVVNGSENGEQVPYAGVAHIVSDITGFLSSFAHMNSHGTHHGGHHGHHGHHGPHGHDDGHIELTEDELNSPFYQGHSDHSDSDNGRYDQDYFVDHMFDDFMPDVKEFELSAGLSEQLNFTFSADNCELKQNRHYNNTGMMNSASLSSRDSLAISVLSNSYDESVYGGNNAHGRGANTDRTVMAALQEADDQFANEQEDEVQYDQSGSGSDSDSSPRSSPRGRSYHSNRRVNDEVNIDDEDQKNDAYGDARSGSGSGSSSGSSSSSDDDEDYGEVIGANR